ncbi:Leucine-rich repeat-containing protein 9 [Hondaea fermentalgiana]|uniref:Leucine-rich repeat-containing protein 9 n=1 Tax=Hondaea fermentalgiana TaxID=2315210 RepID=A0A2R5G831_9STRA|nr:Leucine-rich repeat-containing protein 9 [Hondaea fermentalgiana]|eukprot:GBG23854.1 Leucine-rich repeat-containing protein 9 [Hondaea fermentalgiana]
MQNVEDVEHTVAQVCTFNNLRLPGESADGDGGTNEHARRRARMEVYADVKELEVFQLADLYTMRFTARFPDLVELRVMSQSGVQELRGIGSCVLLEKLWVTNCGLRRLGTEIGNCARLISIDVSNNELTRIRELETLRDLRKLWVNENQLTSLEDVSKLETLEELWAARNFISEIGTSLDKLHSLRELNLAENELRTFKEVLNLARLPKLDQLTLNDPHFGSNPVCLLSNYRTYILCHLRSLNSFDGSRIDEEIKLVTDATFYKKRMYYNMRIKTLKRNMTNVLRKAKDMAGASESRINMSLSVLVRQRKQVQRELDELRIYGERRGASRDSVDAATVKQLENKQLALDACVAGRRAQVAAIADAQIQLGKNVQQIGAKAIEYLNLELESGGNLRLVEGKPGTDSFVDWVRDFCRDAVDATAYKALGLKGVEPEQVLRVHNKSLKVLFEQRVAQITEGSGISNVPIEYAFFVVDKDGPVSSDEIAAGGFPDPATFLAGTGHAAIPLRNFLDSRELRGRRTGLPSTNEFSIVVAQVFPGRHASTDEACALVASKQAVEAQIPLRKRTHAQIIVPPHREARKQIYEERLWGSQDAGSAMFLPESVGANTVLPTRFRGFHVLVNEAPSTSGDQNEVGAQSSKRTPDQSSAHKRKEYLVFDKRLVLPEFIVRLRCVPEECLSARQCTMPGIDSASTCRTPATVEASEVDLSGDVGPLLEPLVEFLNQLPRFETMHGTTTKRCEQVMAMLPRVRARETLAEMSELVVLNWTCQPSLSQLTYLNLHGNNVREIRGLATCKSLKTLILSFNELQEIQGLDTNVELVHLDLGYNAIRFISGLDALCKLQNLELNNNLIHRLGDITAMRPRFPALDKLDLSSNAVCEAPLYTKRCLETFPLLTKLDGRAVTDRDRLLEAARIVVLDDETLAQFARRLAPSITASSLKEVEKIEITKAHLPDLVGIDKLTSLRSVSLAGNDLISVECLAHCQLLEEVNLEENRISKLDGLQECKFLKKLDLGKNRISRISGLEGLTNLAQLSLEDNDIRTLSGLSRLTGLMELYIGNNKIEGLRELQQLRGLPRLLILDTLGNPVSRESAYRLYVVFYLKKLKVLDGVGIERTEVAAARERFAGRLSLEFLTDQVGHRFYEQVHELDLSQSKLRDIEKGCLTGEHFPNLCSLDLGANTLVSVNSIRGLGSLTVLQLSRNRLTGLGAKVLASLPRLQHLELGQNRIESIKDLHLGSCKELRVLRLDGNEISIVDGLEGCTGLRELDLSKNKFRSMESFEREVPALANLRCLHMEDNGLRSLGDLKQCVKLHSLHLNSNRLLDLDELDRLMCIPFLLELSVAGNPVARKKMYRSRVVFGMVALKFLDGKEITNEERLRTDALLSQGGPESLDPIASSYQDSGLTLPASSNPDSRERASGFNLGALTVTGKVPAKAPVFGVCGRGGFASGKGGLNGKDRVRLPRSSTGPAEDAGLTEFQKLFANTHNHKAIWQTPPERSRSGRRSFVQAVRR